MGWRGVVVTVLGTMSGLCAMAQSYPLSAIEPRTASAYHVEAVKRLKVAHDSVAARNLALEALQIEEGYAPAAHLLAQIVADKRLAVEYAERAYRSDTTNYHYYNTLLNTLLNDGQVKRPLELLERHIATSDNPRHFFILAYLHLQGDDIDKALGAIEQGVVRFGREDDLIDLRLRILMSCGRVEEAIREAQINIAAEPYLPQHHVWLANIYSSQRRHTEAEASFREAIRLDNNSEEAWNGLAVELLQQNRIDEYFATRRALYANPAIDVSSKAADLRRIFQMEEFRKYATQREELVLLLAATHPQSAEALILKASYLEAFKGTEESLAVLRSEPLKCNEDARRMAVWMLWGNERHEDALKEVDAALQSLPQSNLLWMMKLSLLQDMKRYNEVIDLSQELLEWVKGEAERANIYEIKGSALHEMGKTKQCYEAYERVLQLTPDNVGALNNYAYFLALDGRDLERALTMIKRVVEREKSNPTYLDTYAWVLHRLGRNEEAKRVQQQAMSLDTTSHAEYALHYGDILYALGDTFMAQTYWKKALERGADEKEINSRLTRAAKDKSKRR